MQALRHRMLYLCYIMGPCLHKLMATPNVKQGCNPDLARSVGSPVIRVAAHDLEQGWGGSLPQQQLLHSFPYFVLIHRGHRPVHHIAFRG